MVFVDVKQHFNHHVCLFEPLVFSSLFQHVGSQLCFRFIVVAAVCFFLPLLLLLLFLLLLFCFVFCFFLPSLSLFAGPFNRMNQEANLVYLLVCLFSASDSLGSGKI